MGHESVIIGSSRIGLSNSHLIAKTTLGTHGARGGGPGYVVFHQYAATVEFSLLRRFDQCPASKFLHQHGRFGFSLSRGQGWAPTAGLT